MARHLIAYGRLITAAEIVARIDAITPEDVRRVGRSILSSAPTLSAIGPTRPLAGADSIAARLGAPHRHDLHATTVRTGPIST